MMDMRRFGFVIDPARLIQSVVNGIELAPLVAAKKWNFPQQKA